MGDSVFQNVEMAPPIEVFQLSKLYNECTKENKVNLGVGGEWMNYEVIRFNDFVSMIF